MSNLLLKKLLQRSGVNQMLEQLAVALATPVVITNKQGQVLWRQAAGSGAREWPLMVNGQLYGWLQGDASSQAIATTLNCLLQQEIEKRGLAQEILQKYEEVNFLSDFAIQVSQCIGLEEMTTVIQRETQNLLKVEEVLVLLYEASQCCLVSPMAQTGLTEAHLQSLFPLVHRVLSSGNPEIINNVTALSALTCPATGRSGMALTEAPATEKIGSLMLAPLTIQNRTFGVFVLCHSQGNLYTSEDLNLFLTLASQVAAAIQTAQYYDKLKHYSQTLELQVAERTWELQEAKEKLEKVNQELQKMAILDELTQIANRRYFNQYLEQEWKRCQREQYPLALILGDVDAFKKYNDFYGHQAGDRCLQQVAKVLSTALKRPGDLVARYGGEEFAMILPQTDLAGAQHVAQRIQHQFSLIQIPHETSELEPFVTMSLGVHAIVPTAQDSLDRFIHHTDKALYQAKAGGRNRIFNYHLNGYRFVPMG
jgi:diguanylate cyclase (GGDEF)-like protein